MPERKGIRVDKAIRSLFPELTHPQIVEAISCQLVTDLKGKKVEKGQRLNSKEELNIEHLTHHLENLKKGENFNVPVIHTGEDFLIVDKPVGVHCHVLSLFDKKTLTQWGLYHQPSIKMQFKHCFSEITPHRLDKDTSGLTIICLSENSFQQWRSWFKDKKIKKSYLAWCWGIPKSTTFEINYDIAHDPKDSSKMICFKKNNTLYRKPIMGAKSLITVLKQLEDCFLCEINCHTGATHQVRVHLACEGYPLMGDSKYDENFTPRRLSLEHHLLRAISITTPNGEFKLDSHEFTNLFN